MHAPSECGLLMDSADGDEPLIALSVLLDRCRNASEIGIPLSRRRTFSGDNSGTPLFEFCKSAYDVQRMSVSGRSPEFQFGRALWPTENDRHRPTLLAQDPADVH